MQQLPDLVVTRATPAGLWRPTVPVMALRGAPLPTPTAPPAPGSDVLFGHFSTFNDWYPVSSMWEGDFLENMAPGSFAETIAADRDQVKTTFNHGHDPTMGDLILGTIDTLHEDTTGPYYEVGLFPSVPGLLRDGLTAGVYGSSFRFMVLADEWDDEPPQSDFNPRQVPQRTITRVRLMEFGPVSWPANPNATAGLRSTTDEFYEELSRSQPDAYAILVARAEELRSPAGHPARAVGAGEKGGGQKTRSAPPPSPVTPPVPAPARITTTSRKGRTTVPTADDVLFPELDVLRTIDDLRSMLGELVQRQNEIQTSFGIQPLPSDVRTEWDALRSVRAECERRIADYQAREDEIRRQATAGSLEPTDPDGPAPFTPAGRGGYSWQQAPASSLGGRSTSARVDTGIYDLSTIRTNAGSPDEAARMFRDRAMRELEARHFPEGLMRRGSRQTLSREDMQTHIANLLDLHDVGGELARRVLVTGSPSYGRAINRMIGNQPLSNEEQRALSSGTGSAGGFALVYYLDPTFIPTSNLSVNPYRAIARVETIVGTNEWRGVTTAGVTASYAAEAAEATDNAPTLAQPAVVVNRAQCFVPVSIELTQDLGSLPQSLASLIQDAKDDLEATQFTTGVGTTVFPQGIVVGATTTTAAAGTASFAAADPYTLEAALGPRFRARASVVANRTIWNKVRQFDTAGGAQLWVYLPQGLQNDVPRGGNLGVQVMGYPAYECSGLASVLTTGTKIMVIGDFGYFVIVDRVGMDIEVIPHLFGASQRPTGQRGFFAYWRNKSLVLDPNAFRVLVTG